MQNLQRKIQIYREDITNITKTYGDKDWRMPEGIREVFANAIDTKASYSYEWVDGFGRISDEGPGIPENAFLIGSTSKSNDGSSIGQFGEGLKMFLLVALRLNRQVFIKTQGYGVEVFCGIKNETEVLGLRFTNDESDTGTDIYIECSKEEWDEAVDMFLQFKDGFHKLDNNLFLPGGYVCILGLKTDEIPSMVFSYDFEDKGMVNRDRNVVKSKSLKTNMLKCLNGIKNQKAIKVYFEALEDKPESDEFKLALEPKNMEVWLSVIRKLYGEKVAYGTSIENDIKATSIGYKVLSGIPKPVTKTLAYLGIMSSKDVSKGVKNDVAVVRKDEILYPIEKSYCSSWTYLEAGREFVANALDTSEKMSVEYVDGYCIIRDNGEGITKKDFVFGASDKTDADIGMFGEGFKIASLVAARENRDITIETIGFTYTPVIEENEEFGTDLFIVKYKQNKRSKGTKVSFKATEEEVSAIKNLFLNFKKNLTIVDGEMVNLIANESGNIYVNGLKSAAVKTLFSYDVKDKSIVDSRDRNKVKEDRLDCYVSEFLSNVTDDAVIEEFLTGWKSDIYSYEYRLIINPENMTPWKKACDKLFQKSCIQGYEMQDNGIAKGVGYELLNNIPAYVKSILERCGVSSASEIAEVYRDSGVVIGNEIVFPMVAEYLKNWTIEDAGREIIANALDTESEIDIKHENGRVIVEDKGAGLKKKSLLIGSSDKTDSPNKIGTFGEGFNMAALLLAKLKRNLRVSTVGYDLNVKFKHDRTFDTDLLVMEMKENDREAGTIVSFDASYAELQATKNRFLVYNESYRMVEENIYLPGGTLFVNGVEICKVNSLYSYNFMGTSAKSLIGRDRNNLNESYAKLLLVDLLGATKNEDVIKSILRIKNTELIENLGYSFSIHTSRRKRWRTVADDVFGKSCLPYGNEEINLVAMDKGFNVLRNLVDTVEHILKIIKFPHANEVVEIRGDEDTARRVVDPSQLSTFGASRWSTIIEVVRKEYGNSVVNIIEICEEFVNPVEGITVGLYSSSHDRIYLLRETLEDDRWDITEVLGIVGHEICHRETRAHDRTREFENALTSKVGELLAKLYLCENN